MTVLEKMLEKVEAGKFTSGCCSISFPYSTVCQMEDAYNGSLDAAKALHEALLPDWCWSIGLGSNATVYIPRRNAPLIRRERSDNPSPAIAWLICIIKALISEQQAKEDG